MHSNHVYIFLFWVLLNSPITWETTSLYYISNIQYLMIAALLALGRPWKQMPYTNLQVKTYIKIMIYYLSIEIFLVHSGCMYGYVNIHKMIYYLSIEIFLVHSGCMYGYVVLVIILINVLCSPLVGYVKYIFILLLIGYTL